MTIEARHLEALAKLIGPDGVLVDAADRRGYETGARYGGGQAACVLRPADTAGVSATVAYLVSNEIAFVPQSGNTGMAGGSVADASGRQVLLSLDRLRQPLEIDPLERIATVGAGVRLSTLNAALAPHGLTLPIDLGADPMLGGMAATNTAGARFLRYGDMRRHIRGLEVVLADGQGSVLDLMSPLRKDNARLDLKQLFIGSAGALGVITRVVVETAPLANRRAAALLIPREPAAALEILMVMEARADARLAAFEGMSANAVQRALEHVPSLRNPFAGGRIPDYAVLVELAETAPDDDDGSALNDRLEAILTELLEAPGAPVADALMGAPEPLWAIRHALSEGLRAAGVVIGLDLSFRRSDVFRFRDEAIPMLTRDWPAYALCDFGHVADGGVHFNLVRPHDDGDHDQDARVADAIVALAVERYGGSFSGEHGLGPVNQRLYDRYAGQAMQAYAGQLQALFAPGRAGGPRLGPSAQGPHWGR